MDIEYVNPVRRLTSAPSDTAPFATRQFIDRTQVEGEIDMVTADEFSAAVEEACMRNCPLDMTRVTFMDSNGLRILLAAAITRDGAPLVVRCSGPVQRLFEVAAPTGVPGLRLEAVIPGI